MRNKTDFLWLTLLIVVVAISARWLITSRNAAAPPPTPVAASPESPVEYARSKAPLSRTSFRFEQTTHMADGKRRTYAFSIQGSGSGGDYEATLSYDGRSQASKGHLSEEQYRQFIDGLESNGVWKLVTLNRSSSDDRIDVYMQAGDWSKNVVLGPEHTSDKLTSRFMQHIEGSLPGNQAKTLGSALGIR